MVKSRRDREYSVNHCIQRYRERYKKVMTHDMYENINAVISNGVLQTPCLLNIINSDIDKSVPVTYTVEYMYNGDKIFVLYDLKRGYISTILDPLTVKYSNTQRIK